jgi:isopropylmalate/homocitrate/citramalate synthase
VTIREVSLRDGLQIEEPIPLQAKLELLEAVVATGVREVEATAFVSPSKVPALADAARLAAELDRFPGIEFSALVASPNGAKRALAAGLRSIEYVVSASDGHSRANVGRSSTEATAQAVADRIPLGGHFHNTRGAGLASAYAAVAAGVTRLDASVGGLGGCPFAPGASGNIATEDLVYLLRDSGIRTDVDLDAAIAAARVAEHVVGHDLPSALLRAGDRLLGT